MFSSLADLSILLDPSALVLQTVTSPATTGSTGSGHCWDLPSLEVITSSPSGTSTKKRTLAKTTRTSRTVAIRIRRGHVPSDCNIILWDRVGLKILERTFEPVTAFDGV